VVGGGIGVSGSINVFGNLTSSSNLISQGISTGSITVGTVTASTINVTNVTSGTLSSATISSTNITAGNLSVGSMTIGSGGLTVTNMFGTNINAGNMTAGAMSSGYVYSNNLFLPPSGIITTGSLTMTGIITTGSLTMTGIITTGSLIASGVVSSLQYVETIVPLTYSATLSANFLSGLVYNVSGTAATITSLALTNVPTTANRAYTFTFIMNTTNANYYISTGTISVNGSSVTLGGTITSSIPSYYIIQQINLFNVGGTFNTAVTTASFF